MEGLVMTAQLLLGLSILVGVHEAGHLLAAKAFGMRVEKFSIGFPPKIWGFTYGETEYSIGAIPLGGFVKISGMIDESLDTKDLSDEPQPWEFRSKPAWQRLIVMMGGIIVNVVTGILIFIVYTYYLGESYLTKEDLNVHGIAAYELGEEIGFKDGDKVVKLNGKDFYKFTDLIDPDVLFNSDSYYTVERKDSVRQSDTVMLVDKVVEIQIPQGFLDKYADKKKYDGFIGYRHPFKVERVMSGRPASDGGLESGDVFVKVNDRDVTYFHDFRKVLKEFAGDTVSAVVTREGSNVDLTFVVEEEGTLGFASEPVLNFSHKDYTLRQSISEGSFEAFRVVWTTIQGFRKIFSGEVSASNSIAGPVGIAQMFGGTWNWMKFWRMTGLLSMVLAFMNFLPIPALDGGHVVFLTYEMVSGQKPSDKFLENAQKVGMVMLLGIMGFAIFNDIYKLLPF